MLLALAFQGRLCQEANSTVKCKFKCKVARRLKKIVKKILVCDIYNTCSLRPKS